METQPDTDEVVEQSPQIVSFVRGVTIAVTHEVIAEVTRIPFIKEPSFPYLTDIFLPKLTCQNCLFHLIHTIFGKTT
jgi:hypothetical protein